MLNFVDLFKVNSPKKNTIRWLQNTRDPETNRYIAPKNGGLDQVRNLQTSRGPPFSGAFAVSFREGKTILGFVESDKKQIEKHHRIP